MSRDLQVEATQRLMEALVEAENRMSRRVQILSDVVFELDEEHLLVFLNEAWPTITGCAIDSSLQRPLAAFVLAEDRPAFLDWLAATDRESAVTGHTCRLNRADRRIAWAEFSARPVPAGGLVGVLRDVTARRAQEAEQLRVQRLQSIGTLAGGIAHDLNNALSPILMGLGLLRDRVPEDARSLLDPMVASAEHGAAMVRQVLLFARGAEFQRLEVVPLRLVDDIAKIMRSSFPRHITIETNCRRDLPSLLGDFTQLHQVLLNLCVNARDAMPEGGRLRVTVTAATVTPGEGGAPADSRWGEHVVFSVSDTGTGIAPEVVERMFEPFYTTKAPDKGTGLGLSTVLGIVRNHGGFIRVETAPGHGTTFEVWLPGEARVESTRRARELVSQATMPGVDPGRILFVDDDPAVRAIAGRVLQTAGHTVTLAVDGAEALRLICGGAAFDVILTDLDMPRLSGLELVRRIRQSHPSLPVVVCSGRMGDDEAAELRKLGAARFVAKPFTRESLLAVVERARGRGNEVTS